MIPSISNTLPLWFVVSMASLWAILFLIVADSSVSGLVEDEDVWYLGDNTLSRMQTYA